MQTHTLNERAEFYNKAFPQYPDSHLKASNRWLSGIWICGNDYAGSGMYGAYPPAYLKRITKVFPDAERVMHLFSGSLKREATRKCVTVDVRREGQVVPGIQGDALKLPFLDQSFDLIYADTPYSVEDAKRYGTGLPSRQKVLYEAHRVMEPGGFLVWMDTVLPMYAKTHWQWIGAIPMFRSTNHRVRAVMIFERQP